jgi:hypothetical protein
LAPRVLDDWTDSDDPGTAAISRRCPGKLDALLCWRRCRTHFRAPADAELLECPACGRLAPPDQW